MDISKNLAELFHALTFTKVKISRRPFEKYSNVEKSYEEKRRDEVRDGSAIFTVYDQIPRTLKHKEIKRNIGSIVPFLRKEREFLKACLAPYSDIDVLAEVREVGHYKILIEGAKRKMLLMAFGEGSRFDFAQEILKREDVGVIKYMKRYVDDLQQFTNKNREISKRENEEYIENGLNLIDTFEYTNYEGNISALNLEKIKLDKVQYTGIVTVCLAWLLLVSIAAQVVGWTSALIAGAVIGCFHPAIMGVLVNFFRYNHLRGNNARAGILTNKKEMLDLTAEIAELVLKARLLRPLTSLKKRVVEKIAVKLAENNLQPTMRNIDEFKMACPDIYKSIVEEECNNVSTNIYWDQRRDDERLDKRLEYTDERLVTFDKKTYKKMYNKHLNAIEQKDVLSFDGGTTRFLLGIDPDLYMKAADRDTNHYRLILDTYDWYINYAPYCCQYFAPVFYEIERVIELKSKVNASK